jgi:tetratricopeptide (TPR) repeat protein
MSRERLEASGYIMSGEYYRIPKLLHIETYEGDLLSMLGQAYFFMGKFEQAYETYQKLYFNPNVCSERLCNKAPEEYDPLGKTIFEVLELSNGKHLMDILPEYTNMDFEYLQSIETSDEQYEEYKEFVSLRNYYENTFDKNDKTDFYMFFNKLKEMEESQNVKEVAKSYFFEGEIWFSGGDFKKAFACYLEAAKTEVSKALYYGYAGNMLMKETQKNEDNLFLRIPASILTSRAIDLDYNNAKWHFNEGFILASLGKIFSVNGQINKAFIKSAIHEMKVAQYVLRSDQLQLRKEVEKGLHILQNAYF